MSDKPIPERWRAVDAVLDTGEAMDAHFRHALEELGAAEAALSEALQERNVAVKARDNLYERWLKLTHEFKNFHASLCKRFDYSHDDIDWKRDQVSLEEHIAQQVGNALARVPTREQPIATKEQVTP